MSNKILVWYCPKYNILVLSKKDKFGYYYTIRNDGVFLDFFYQAPREMGFDYIGYL